MPVLWAGVLVALSVCAYGINRPWLGVAFGLAAVFFRELALPYCLLCAAMAWWQGRRGELAAWTLGLAALAGVFRPALVAGERIDRARRHGPSPRLDPVRRGGLRDLHRPDERLSVAVAAMGDGDLPGGGAGRIGRLEHAAGHADRPEHCLFLVAFAVVGQSFNQYWGWLIGPLLCFGVVRFPASLRDLCEAAGMARVALEERVVTAALRSREPSNRRRCSLRRAVARHPSGERLLRSSNRVPLRLSSGIVPSRSNCAASSINSA